MLRGSPLPGNLSRIAALFAGATVDNFQIQPGSAAGKTLRELDIRKNTGATVIAVARNGEAITNPGPDFRIEPDDIIVLLGAHHDLDQAVSLLTRGISQRPTSDFCLTRALLSDNIRTVPRTPLYTKEVIE